MAPADLAPADMASNAKVSRPAATEIGTTPTVPLRITPTVRDLARRVSIAITVAASERADSDNKTETSMPQVLPYPPPSTEKIFELSNSQMRTDLKGGAIFVFEHLVAQCPVLNELPAY